VTDFIDDFLSDMREWIRNNSLSEDELIAARNNPIPGPKHCDETKQQIAESNRSYYQTDRGIQRRKKLSEWNSTVKSQEMKNRWLDDYDTLRDRTKSGGRRKGSKDKGTRVPKQTIMRVTDGRQIYKDAYEASLVYGIHPVNVRRRCRKMVDGWRYV